MPKQKGGHDVEQVSVFDITAALLNRAPGGELPTLKLQKLCFYVYGWYAHLTGEQLFPETFYAMEKGPVVGELLSAHAGLKKFTQEQLADQFTEREVDPQPLSPYIERIVDAVWDKHRNTHFMDLVDQTHDESVWITAWEGRRPGSKRGNLPAEDLVEHFLLKKRPPQEQLDLPLSLVSRICEETLAEVDAPIESATPFVETIRRLQQVS